MYLESLTDEELLSYANQLNLTKLEKELIARLEAIEVACKNKIAAIQGKKLVDLLNEERDN